jgi:membrane-associated phospholipid phosphatase
MDLSDFDNYWVELEKEKQLGISPETVKKIIERLLLESHLKLASLRETDNKDIIATSTDRLSKEAKTLIRIEEEPNGADKEDVEDFYSNLASMNVLNAIYIINSYFTKDAREYATGLPIRLVDRKELSDLIYEVEALKFEKAFVSEINDTKATRYFRSKVKQRITNIFLGLKDKVEEIDRRYLPVAYFSIKKTGGSTDTRGYAYVDLSTGDLFYVDEGLLKRTDVLRQILELPQDAKQQLIDLIEQGDLPYQHLNSKAIDLLEKKQLAKIYEKKRGGGILEEIIHLISFIVAEITEPLIPRGKYQDSSLTKNRFAGANLKTPPFDNSYNLEYFIDVSNTQDEFDADQIKYKPAEIEELLKRILGADVKFAYNIYFPYYLAKYSGPQGTRYESKYSPKFKEFFPKSGSYSSVHNIIDKFPDLPYLLVALIYIANYYKETQVIIDVLAASLLFSVITIAIGIGLKSIFKTERTTPFYGTQDYGIKSFRYGFPSLHSLASMGAVSFVYFIKPGGEYLTAAMLIISLFYIRSRLRIGAHSRTDVIGGAIVGFFLGIGLGILLFTPILVLPEALKLLMAALVVIGMVASLIFRLKYIF